MSPPVPNVPNALGERARAEAVLSTLSNLQREELELELRRTAEGRKPDDTFAVRDDTRVTFKEEKRRLATAVRSVMGEHADILPRVRREIERRAATEEAEAAG